MFRLTCQASPYLSLPTFAFASILLLALVIVLLCHDSYLHYLPSAFILVATVQPRSKLVSCLVLNLLRLASVVESVASP